MLILTGDYILTSESFSYQYIFFIFEILDDVGFHVWSSFQCLKHYFFMSLTSILFSTDVYPTVQWYYLYKKENRRKVNNKLRESGFGRALNMQLMHVVSIIIITNST